MKNCFHLYISLLLFVLLVSCKGQDQKPQSKGSISQLEGDLPDSSSFIADFNTIIRPNAPTRITRKVRQDNEGNLLMAAYDDIVRYDGNSFTHIAKEEGLDTCYAFDVLEDKKGNIWIASNHVGAYRYDLASGGFTHFTTEDGLAHNRNMCIYEDKVGNIWIGGGDGVWRYDGKTLNYFTGKQAKD